MRVAERQNDISLERKCIRNVIGEQVKLLLIIICLPVVWITLFVSKCFHIIGLCRSWFLSFLLYKWENGFSYASSESDALKKKDIFWLINYMLWLFQKFNPTVNNYNTTITFCVYVLSLNLSHLQHFCIIDWKMIYALCLFNSNNLQLLIHNFCQYRDEHASLWKTIGHFWLVFMEMPWMVFWWWFGLKVAYSDLCEENVSWQ